MDYDSDSSDFHFPTDTGMPKLSSPLNLKVPEVHDWAFDEFIETMKEKPYTDAEDLLSFTQYIPVEDDEDEGYDTLNYGPPKLTLPLFEEKDLLQQISQHILNQQKMELLDILKGGFTLIQSNKQEAKQQNAIEGLAWIDEVINDVNEMNQIENLDSVQDNDMKAFNPYSASPEQQQQQQVTTAVLPEKDILPIQETTITTPKKKKNKFGKFLKSPTSKLLKSTKKFFRKLIS